MRHRDLLAIREHREEVEAQERAEKERREAPIRAAQEQFNASYRKLGEVYRERLRGEIPDPEPITIDPVTVGVRMTPEQAQQFNREEFAKYRAAFPAVYFTDELLENMGAYFAANSLRIVTASMIGELVERYRTAGMLPDPPQAEPEPEQTTEPELTRVPEPEVYIGRDWQSGKEREFTRLEIDRMSSEEYRKAFPVLPTMKAVLTAMKEQRAR